MHWAQRSVFLHVLVDDTPIVSQTYANCTYRHLYVTTKAFVHFEIVLRPSMVKNGWNYTRFRVDYTA